MSMPKIILFFLLAISGTHSFAQQAYYMYVQAGAAQPFYARIQNRIYSSSENGYMIVPRLHDSTYEVFIGFARNVIPEQHFSVEMNKQDQGFELRNFGEKGWGLFNLQNMAVIMNTNLTQPAPTGNTGERKNDAFSAMLANVVNDSAILYAAAKPVTVPPVKIEPVKEPELTIKDTAVTLTSSPVTKPVTAPPAEEKKEVLSDTVLVAKAAEKKAPVPVPPPVKEVVTTTPATQNKVDSVTTRNTPKKSDPTTEKPFIVRVSESKNEDGYQAVYIEQYNFSTDTVNIVIPVKETPPAAITQTARPAISQKTPDTTAAVVTANPPVTVLAADTASEKKQALVVTNSDCKNLASDNDVDKLRVKIIAENAVDDKLVVARKYFKAKCYSVKQIKALTELFPSDESKYRFFDTSYPFISDTDNFSSLEELISNDYYKTRFKAMIHK